MIEHPQLLAAFYNEVTQEIRRLREERWRFSYYFIAEATGVILLAGDGKLDRFINLPVLIFLFFIQLACIIFYLYHMYLSHGYLTDARNTRRRLERFFGLHGLTSEGDSIVPAGWKLPNVHMGFEVRSVVLPLALFVVGVQAGSIYAVVRLIWGMSHLACVE
jgi:hypothetical protein